MYNGTRKMDYLLTRGWEAFPEDLAFASDIRKKIE